MKKNISINISGIIFHIEEDGYEQLKEYLRSINNYFSTFDDSSEIVADIESRIAEIFLSKLSEGKQVITVEDVAALITTMGSIQDFQAVEDETIGAPAPSTSYEEAQDEQEPVDGAKKKLYRDNKRRLIGGVAAGIANYFSIDPLWIRLIFIIMLFDVFLTFSLSALVILVYVILWVVLPPSYTLKEDKQLKKIYRNPDGSVIGGVANGISAYFDIDVTVVRILFVVTTFAGLLGLFAYIVLWIILPEAKSITDKVQMTGEAVTLENIEQNIKKSEEKKLHHTEESALVKVLLFPFRLIAKILKGLAYALGPMLKFVIEAIRVIAGLIIMLSGLSLLFAVLVSGAVFLGLMVSNISMGDFPVELFRDTFPPLGIVAAIIVAGIPSIGLIFLGISILSKSRVVNPTIGWTMFALWLFGLIGLSFVLPSVVYEFRTEGTYSKTEYFDVDAKTLVLDINQNGFEDYREPRLKLRGYEGDQIKLVQDFSARGSNRQKAVDQAQLISYLVTTEDSIITFDANFDFGPDAVFRDQELRMTLYIPYGQEFIMKDNFDDLLYYSFSYQGYRNSDIIGNTWVYNPSGLDCITCDTKPSYDEERRQSFEDQYNDNLNVRGYHQTFDFEDFNQLMIEGPYEANVVQGEEYRVVVTGYEENVDATDVLLDGNELIIRYGDNNFEPHRYNRRMNVKIICPELKEIRLKGAATGSILGFEEDEVYVKLTGAAELILDADIHFLDVDLSGASRLDLVGRGEKLTVDLSTASYLDSYGFKVKNARIKASGASKAKVYASEILDIKASLISKIKYRGGAEVISDRTSSMSTIEEQ
jgi:phage shock protein PspC (stress-responsive transcriptional regulator)